LTDYLELTVGGTLSVGGLGGASHRCGAQVDQALELEVVAGTGEVVTCSLSRERELFEAALAGLGQCGIIARARLRLVPADTKARVFRLLYDTPGAMMHDAGLLVAEERCSHLAGYLVPGPYGEWAAMLEAAAGYTPPAAPDDAYLLAGQRPT